MKKSYPVILTPEDNGFTVFVPDFDINTQGRDLTEAIEMSRDGIGLMGIDMKDDGEEIPTPRSIETIKASAEDTVLLVDVDFAQFRHKN